MAQFNVSLKMKKVLSIFRLGFVYRMFIGGKPSSFLIAFWAIFSIKAFWVCPIKRFPYLRFSRITNYV